MGSFVACRRVRLAVCRWAKGEYSCWGGWGPGEGGGPAAYRWAKDEVSCVRGERGARPGVREGGPGPAV